ncbi:hypothetical protein ABMC88_16880 [Sulfitobacter sp. HNIBRBA2951]|uniref:hypothetical protein n=1 Tax=Sulfitobacter aquimarinus TaxID=3158557 RepID=UPI0032DED463
MKIIPKSDLEPVWTNTGQRTGCIPVHEPFPHSVLPFMLYEANAWLGGPAGRVLVVRSLAGHQPSLDGLLAGLIGFEPVAAMLPFGIRFDVHSYQNMDQLDEDATTRSEVQSIIGLLTVCLIGDVSCVLRSTDGTCDIEIHDQSVTFWYSTASEKTVLIDILGRYGIDVDRQQARV